jgi:hypothetical protein
MSFIYPQKLERMVASFVFSSLSFSLWTKFDYKTTTHYMAINKIIHVYFIHMIYLMSHVTSLNNTCGLSYKLPRSGL